MGHQWSPHSSEMRDFLGRNFVPHQWLNVETDETAKQLLDTTGAGCFGACRSWFFPTALF